MTTPAEYIEPISMLPDLNKIRQLPDLKVKKEGFNYNYCFRFSDYPDLEILNTKIVLFDKAEILVACFMETVDQTIEKFLEATKNITIPGSPHLVNFDEKGSVLTLDVLFNVKQIDHTKIFYGYMDSLESFSVCFSYRGRLHYDNTTKVKTSYGPVPENTRVEDYL
jgi:hypothetical protein